MSKPRYAVYYAPAADSALWRFGSATLGYDALTGEDLPFAVPPGCDPAAWPDFTAEPRRYGFHATLKAPFRLAPGETEASLRAALDAFARQTPAVTIPRLVVSQIDGFFALVPAAPLQPLNGFAGEVVRAFDPFRAPLTDAEIERRNPDSLKPAEFRNLGRWGYPYVFETFRFHMTLSGRAAPQESPRLRAALEELFSGVLVQPVPVDALTLFIESEPGAPFMALSRHELGPASARRSA